MCKLLNTGYLMKNPFEELDDYSKHPSPQLRNKVLGSYNLLSSFAKTVELFMGNFAYTIAEVIKLAENHNKKNNPPPNDNVS